MAIKWGTPDKVRLIDMLTSAPLEMGASGELNLQGKDSRKLLIKLVGTQSGIAWHDRYDQRGCCSYIRSEGAARVVTFSRFNSGHLELRLRPKEHHRK